MAGVTRTGTGPGWAMRRGRIKAKGRKGARSKGIQMGAAWLEITARTSEVRMWWRL